MNPTLIGLALTMLLAQLGTSIANVALPTFAQSFGVPSLDAQAVVSVYLLMVTLGAAVVGPLGDRWGRRRMLLVGLATLIVASGAAALSPNLATLLVARAVQGVGASLLLVFSLALVGDAVPAEKMGRAMGLLGTMNAVGTALGPSLGGLLLSWFGWPSLFGILIPLGALAAGLLAWKLPKESRRLGRLPRGLPRERRGSRLIGLVQNGLAMAVLMTTLVVGPFYLSEVLALDSAHLGLVMTVGPLVAALVGIPAGHLVDRWSAHRLVGWGLGGMALASLLLAVAPGVWGVVGYIVGLALLTACYSLFQTANNTAVLAGISPEQRGAVSGWLSLSRNLGLLAGTAGLGGLFAVLGSPPTAFSVTFGVGAVLLGLGLLAQSLGVVRGVAPAD